MEKFWNKFGNIMYYTFNFLTLPILIIISTIKYYEDFPSWMKLTNSVGQPMLIPLLTVGFIALIWRYQFLIGEAYTHETKFGLDFFKHKRILEEFNNLTPLYNKPTISNHLERLFKKYCKDETICIRHKSSNIRNFRGGDLKDFVECDKNFLTGFYSSYIYNGEGFKIDLGEEPPLFLVKINSRFDNDYGYLGVSKKLDKAISFKTSAYRVENGQDSIDVCYSSYDKTVSIKEYAIIMGTLIDFVTESEYLKLKELHKKAEFNYDKYILNKRNQ